MKYETQKLNEPNYSAYKTVNRRRKGSYIRRSAWVGSRRLHAQGQREFPF